MSKTMFNTLIAIIIGLIAAIMIYLSGQTAGTSAAIGLLVTVFIFALLLPSIIARIKRLCCEYDWEQETTSLYLHIPQIYRHSFWLLFGFINLAFLFHTINFMWGATDWAAVRTAVDTNESIADGRFAAFFLQNLAFNGKILPVINNLLAFAGLSLAGVLLGIYWNLPKKTPVFVIAGLLLTVSPYTLSWLYSAKNTLGILWLPAIALIGLLLSEYKPQSQNKSFVKNLISVLLILFALGTFFPVINFIAVAVLGKILIQTTYSDVRFKDAALRCCQALANITAAGMLYILILSILSENGSLKNSYSLFAPFIACWTNIPALLKITVTQFVTPLPFADIVYQLTGLLLIIASLFVIIFKTPNTTATLRGLLLIPFILVAGKISVLFSLNQEETAEYLAQLNFFDLPLIYVLMLTLLLKLGGAYTRRGAYLLTVLLIFMSFVRLAYAQKVWKFGWDAEIKLAERIITRLEKHQDFSISRQYKLLQIGEVSMRGKYYHKAKAEQPNSYLLEESYYPARASKDAYNFFYPADFISENVTINDVLDTPVREYLLTKARPWPAKESIFIYKNYIVLILNETALLRTQQALQK